MIRRQLALLLILSLMLAALPVVAIASRSPSDKEATVRFDTPEPREGSTPRRPRRTPRPRRPGQGPAATPTTEPQPPQQLLSPVALAPARDAITVGYREPDILGRAPLLLALLQGYFAEAGFEDVFIVEAADPLAGLRGGELDFAVVDAFEAAAAASSTDPTLRAVAGFQDPDAAGGVDGGRDLLVAAPGLVSDEPATVIAFLAAYIRALQDLADPATAAAALAQIEATGAQVDPDTAAGWTDAVAVFAPFDGGFGVTEGDDGLDQLVTDLEVAGIAIPDMSYFIAGHTLDIAQALQGLPASPDGGLRPPPGLAEIRVGVPTSDAAGPISQAVDAGYLEEAGFTSVDIMDVEQPLLGLLNGELDFGVVSVVDAADGVAQGLPLKVLAGHRNGGAGGADGGDVLVASVDLLEQEPSTAVAFLIAYLRALQDLEADPDTDGFAPYDGGFGDRSLDGGTAELSGQLAGILGQEPDLHALLADGELEYAQAWWGLPANPIRVPISDGTASDDLAADQEAA